MHATLESNSYQSAMLLQVYKGIAEIYSANTLIIDSDEDVLTYELQRFLNTAVALLLIDSNKKVFTSSLYQELDIYLTITEKDLRLVKVESCIESLIQQLPIPTKNYLQTTGLLDFTELKGIIEQDFDVSIFIQEILELPITVANELNGDFEGGYDFHEDDDEDLAYLMPDP